VPKDIEERAGFSVTTPLRTLLDVADSGVPEEQLQKAVADALARGLVRRKQLLEAARKRPRARRLLRILDDRRITAPSGDEMARKFGSAAAFKSALEAHLRKRAEERKVPLSTLQLKFVIERLLARLFYHPDPGWLLKGGFALDLRFRPQARTTKDVDLSI